MIRAAVLAIPLLLAACVEPMPPIVPEQPPQMPMEDACGAAQLQDLVGQPAARLETMRFAGPVRVIRPGMAVTMDYSANRLNITVDEREKIVRVICG